MCVLCDSQEGFAFPSSGDGIGESSDEDEPIEDMDFIEKHKEWIDKVMKDDMSFTVALSSRTDS